MSTRFDAVDSCVLGLGLLGEWSIKPSPGMVLAPNNQVDFAVTTLSRTSETSSHRMELATHPYVPCMSVMLLPSPQA